MTQRCARLADDALKRAVSVADSIMEVGQEMVIRVVREKQFVGALDK